MPFKEFLISLNISYMAGKFGANRHFNAESTLKHYRDQINECVSDKDEKTNLLIEVESLRGIDNENEFALAVSTQCDNLMAYFDHCPEMVREICPLFRRFYNEVWPVFLEHIKNEQAETLTEQK